MFESSLLCVENHVLKLSFHYEANTSFEMLKNILNVVNNYVHIRNWLRKPCKGNWKLNRWYCFQAQAAQAIFAWLVTISFRGKYRVWQFFVLCWKSCWWKKNDYGNEISDWCGLTRTRWITTSTFETELENPVFLMLVNCNVFLSTKSIIWKTYRFFVLA